MVIFSAFILALIVSVLFSPYRRSSLVSLAILFAILFMAGVSSQYWITPVGPSYWGVYWVPMILTVLVFLLLFLAPPPSGEYIRRTKNSTEEITLHKEKTDHAPTEVIGLLTWIIFLILIIVTAAGFYNSAV